MMPFRLAELAACARSHGDLYGGEMHPGLAMSIVVDLRPGAEWRPSGNASRVQVQSALGGLPRPTDVVPVLGSGCGERCLNREICDNVLDCDDRGLGQQCDDLSDGRLHHLLQNALEGDASRCNLGPGQQCRQAGGDGRQRQGDTHGRAEVGQFSDSCDLPGDDDVGDTVKRARNQTCCLGEILVLALHLRPVIVQGRQRFGLATGQQGLDVAVGDSGIVVRVVGELA
ncbi:hypothetical protein CP974_18725 [Streptomyces fradiae ATCC 10745 = DSM 40063]|nr:hypothetical protein CP974_18725 [Streptomyces fradiae ATCC 10745 = DSM 40063]